MSKTATEIDALAQFIAQSLRDTLKKCCEPGYHGELCLTLKFQAGVPQLMECGDVQKHQFRKG